MTTKTNNLNNPKATNQTHSTRELRRARRYAAQVNSRCAKAAKEHYRIVYQEKGHKAQITKLTALYFASHVTKEQVQAYIVEEQRKARAIRRGKNDENCTVAQRISHYLESKNKAAN